MENIMVDESYSFSLRQFEKKKQNESQGGVSDRGFDR